MHGNCCWTVAEWAVLVLPCFSTATSPPRGLPLVMDSRFDETAFPSVLSFLHLKPSPHHPYSFLARAGVLGNGPRASCMLNTCSVTERHSQSLTFAFDPGNSLLIAPIKFSWVHVSSSRSSHLCHLQVSKWPRGFCLLFPQVPLPTSRLMDTSEPQSGCTWHLPTGPQVPYWRLRLLVSSLTCMS